MYTCYVDITAASDNIIRDYVLPAFKNSLSLPEFTDCIDLIEELYQPTKLYMTVETFQTSTEMQQCVNTSPSLFNLLIDYALRIYVHLLIALYIRFKYK